MQNLNIFCILCVLIRLCAKDQTQEYCLRACTQRKEGKFKEQLQKKKPSSSIGGFIPKDEA